MKQFWLDTISDATEYESVVAYCRYIRSPRQYNPVSFAS